MSRESKTSRNPRAGIFVVSVEDRHLFVLVATLLVVLIGALTVFAVVQLNVNATIKKNSSGIAANTHRIDHQEQRDVNRLRKADARLCARENLVRAEVHVAYQQQQPMPPPEAFVDQPILKVLLDQARVVQSRGLARVRQNLPILECAPNLEGDAAYPLSEEKQSRFVRLYLEGKLEPVPDALDAAIGPDE